VVVGFIDSSIVIGEKRVVVIGGGRIGILSGNECILVSMKTPLLVSNIHCGSIIALGLKEPIVAGVIRTDRLYTKKLYVKKLIVNTATLGEQCIIEELESARELIFTDPHMYIKKIGRVEKTFFSYKIMD